VTPTNKEIMSERYYLHDPLRNVWAGYYLWADVVFVVIYNSNTHPQVRSWVLDLASAREHWKNLSSGSYNSNPFCVVTSSRTLSATLSYFSAMDIEAEALRQYWTSCQIQYGSSFTYNNKMYEDRKTDEHYYNNYAQEA
jgi:hypothetical protein